MKILNQKQVYNADKATIKSQNISSTELMERAAINCYNWIHNRIKGFDFTIHIFCGIGNNGGDGLVLARLLHQNGYQVKCYVVNFSEKRSPDFLVNYNRLKEIGEWPTVITSEKEIPIISNEDIVIDAIFGIGLKRSPSGFTKSLIQYINTLRCFVLSIDFPSGLFSEKPVTNKDAVIKATHTLTFQSPKLAFLLPDNKDYTLSWEVIDIDLDATFLNQLKATNHYTQKQDILPIYKYRERFSHKGSYGHSMLIGGSYGKIGAVVLASKAALKIGSGLVTSFIPKCGYEILQTSIPEVMVEVDDEKEICYFNFKTKPTVIGVGTGLSTSEKTTKGFENFLKNNKLPLIIDADALNIIANNKSFLNLLPSKTIITPHPKELERLIGTWKNDYEKLDKIKKLSTEFDIIVVLKGAHTIITYKEECFFNSSGNPALATAGSGDVLTGIITGLVAQGYEPLNAAIFGVYLHGRTADIALQHLAIETFTASDVTAYISDAYIELFEKPSPENKVEENA